MRQPESCAPADLGLGASLALGVRHAMRAKPQAVLVVLADMPMVSPGHVANLLEALSYGEDLIASSNGSVAMPPALFGRRYFERLLRLSGDRGAQHLLANARRIEAAPGELVDVDRLQDAVARCTETPSGAQKSVADGEGLPWTQERG